MARERTPTILDEAAEALDARLPQHFDAEMWSMVHRRYAAVVLRVAADRLRVEADEHESPRIRLPLLHAADKLTEGIDRD